MTPDEARKRWCPMAAKNPDNQRCIADECMAWRWSWSPKQAEQKSEMKLTGTAGAYVTVEKPRIEPYGYCGLAGAHGNDRPR